MQPNTPLRNSNTCTPGILTWPESSPPVPSSGHRSHQPSEKIGEVLRGAQITEEEKAQSLATKKPRSGYRMKELIENRKFSDNAEDTASEAKYENSKNRTGIRVYQQAMNGISQISFSSSTEERISPKKLVSLPEEAKQHELGGALQDEPEAERRKQMSNSKAKELNGNEIFGPPTEIAARSLAAPRTLESKGNKDLGEHAPQPLHTSTEVPNPAGGQSNILVEKEPVKNTSKKMHNQKFAEMTGNDIFKKDVSPGSAGKPLGTARHREMAGSDIFADGMAENRHRIVGSGSRRQMAGSDIFADGKAENRDHILGARRPPGGGSSIVLD